jgi:DNA-binding response OmpR family regulator
MKGDETSREAERGHLVRFGRPKFTGAQVCSSSAESGQAIRGPEAVSGCAETPVSTPLQFQTNPPDHILVVEDDFFFRRLNTKVLMRAGYDVDAATDGAAAWQALSTDGYDLLITDHQMPKMSGMELLKKLRDARMAMPVILATGTLPREEFTRYPWLQSAATLLKPYTGEEILRLVKKVLREADHPPDNSQFLVHVDMKRKTSHAEEATGARPQSPTRHVRRILVVDEDSDLRQLYAEALAGLGYHVDAAEDGIAAWKALKANRYNLLITEHEMPNLTGIELVKMLRAARMAVPVVMAADRLPIYELARNPSLQLAAALPKPFAVGALLDTVQEVLRATDSPPEQIQPRPVWQTQPSDDGLWLR